ncbi:MAG: PrsW family glutamic-type intramembrane protease [Paludibacteraceae bacterium]|nr:PrsW family glutamic-type intramembrane protease [Paludibacteraceae bacterium]
MEIIALLSLALFPATAFLIYIYRKDKKNPEPISMLIKGIFYGMLSCCLSLFFTSFQEEGGVEDVVDAFVGAAIPEELAKLIMLWWLVRKCKYFDEPIDGIVYAVCVGMGFAGLENIAYLLDSADIISLAVARGVFSIPGHFCFAVCMGYFYSKAHFGKSWNMVYRFLAYFVPMLLHGIYDGLLSVQDEDLNIIALPIWLVFCVWMYAKAIKRIGKLNANAVSEKA